MESVTKQATGRGRPAENGAQGARADRRDDPRASCAPSAPDLDMIVAVERKIADRRLFASRSELRAALHADISSAKLDRVLEYLEGSAKISTGNGSIRWTFGSAGPQEGSSAGEVGGGASAADDATKEPAGVLGTAERASADLDNDLPYSEETERLIADCEAGRPIGKTYTAEEYLRHLEQEYGDGALEHPRK